MTERAWLVAVVSRIPKVYTVALAQMGQRMLDMFNEAELWVNYSFALIFMRLNSPDYFCRAYATTPNDVKFEFGYHST
jgi:hypothetical protein